MAVDLTKLEKKFIDLFANVTQEEFEQWLLNKTKPMAQYRNKYTPYVLVILAFASLLLCAVFSSCNTNPKSKRAFIVGKTDDNNWTTSAYIECDSVDMISLTQAKYWVDGKSYNLFAKSYIKIASNPEYNETYGK